MESITIREFIDGKAEGRPVFLPTFNGPQEIGYIRGVEYGDPWAVNKNGIASWCVHYGHRLYFSREDAARAGQARVECGSCGWAGKTCDLGYECEIGMCPESCPECGGEVFPDEMGGDDEPDYGCIGDEDDDD